MNASGALQQQQQQQQLPQHQFPSDSASLTERRAQDPYSKKHTWDHIFPPGTPQQATTGPTEKRWLFGDPVISPDERDSTRGHQGFGAFAAPGFQPFEPQPPPPPPREPAADSEVTGARARVTRLWPEGNEAVEFLEDYNTFKGHLFPFAVVPPHLDSTQLKTEKPFFWKAIMMTACHMDGLRQMAMGNELLKEVCEAAFMRPQKTLDLLQGLMILISW
jgi:hypothetical protein